MADKRIGDLDPIQELSQDALFVAEQAGSSGKVTAAQVKELAQEAAEDAARSAQDAALAASRYPRVRSDTGTWEVWDPSARVWVDTGLKAAGDPGVGVPSGGSTGRILRKRTDDDYDTEWSDESVKSVNGMMGEVVIPVPPVAYANWNGSRFTITDPSITLTTGSFIAIVFDEDVTQEHGAYTVRINGGNTIYLRLTSAEGDGTAKVPDTEHWTFKANRPYIFSYRDDGGANKYLICTTPKCAPLDTNWTVPIKYGGTGATTKEQAVTNLGLAHSTVLMEVTYDDDTTETFNLWRNR